MPVSRSPNTPKELLCLLSTKPHPVDAVIADLGIDAATFREEYRNLRRSGSGIVGGDVLGRPVDNIRKVETVWIDPTKWAAVSDKLQKWWTAVHDSTPRRGAKSYMIHTGEAP